MAVDHTETQRLFFRGNTGHCGARCAGINSPVGLTFL
jgi:hypothetical protein